MAAAEPYRMSPTEVARGYLLGYEGALPPPRPDASREPRDALERVVRESLARPPCGVAFSGGRDSSTVLAIAVHVARRDGLPEPVPITRVFPDVPAAEESRWQELVIRHLGVRDWHRVVIGDELDLVGPLAVPRLERHGVVWPPTLHGDVPLLEAVRGGSVLDGEGGDEVLGVEAHRIRPLTQLLRRPRPLRWRRVRSALGSVAPRRLREQVIRRHAEELGLTWLQPAARAEMIADHVRAEASRPLSYRTSVAAVPCRRTQSVLARNRRFFARGFDVRFRSPLLDPDVVRALGATGGILGHGDRAAALRAIVGDLLPEPLLARTSKATFGGAFMGPHARAFAADWLGDGLDPDLVDARSLQEVWRAGRPNALTAALLQAAWLAGRNHGLVNTSQTITERPRRVDAPLANDDGL